MRSVNHVARPLREPLERTARIRIPSELPVNIISSESPAIVFQPEYLERSFQSVSLTAAL